MMMRTDVIGARMMPREDGAHADEREGADGLVGVVEERAVERAERAAQHAADEERGREDAARAAARIREARWR